MTTTEQNSIDCKHFASFKWTNRHSIYRMKCLTPGKILLKADILIHFHDINATQNFSDILHSAHWAYYLHFGELNWLQHQLLTDNIRITFSLSLSLVLSRNEKTMQVCVVYATHDWCAMPLLWAKTFHKHLTLLSVYRKASGR